MSLPYSRYSHGAFNLADLDASLTSSPRSQRRISDYSGLGGDSSYRTDSFGLGSSSSPFALPPSSSFSSDYFSTPYISSLSKSLSRQEDSLPTYNKKGGRLSVLGKCHCCGDSATPEWRKGPAGRRTLCNSCGLHMAKLRLPLASTPEEALRQLVQLGNSRFRLPPEVNHTLPSGVKADVHAMFRPPLPSELTMHNSRTAKASGKYSLPPSTPSDPFALSPLTSSPFSMDYSSPLLSSSSSSSHTSPRLGSAFLPQPRRGRPSLSGIKTSDPRAYAYGRSSLLDDTYSSGLPSSSSDMYSTLSPSRSRRPSLLDGSGPMVKSEYSSGLSMSSSPFDMPMSGSLYRSSSPSLSGYGSGRSRRKSLSYM